MKKYIKIGLITAILTLGFTITTRAQTIYDATQTLTNQQTMLIDCPDGRISITRPQSHRGRRDHSQLIASCKSSSVLGTSTPRIAATPTANPTPTQTPKPTTSPAPTPTKIPLSPTPTPTPLVSSNITPTPIVLTSLNTWHEPDSHDGLNVHEHGDQPPTWANEWSQVQFGHPVIFGGDESTPNENLYKHQAYKGFSMTSNGVELYIRYHAMSNPMGRTSPFHSYEIYAKDQTDNISFWQGWNFYGYPEHRDQRMTRRNEQPGYDPTNGITWPGRGQFIIAGADKLDWNNYLRCEQWYGHGGYWAWDLSITICGATTYYSVDEHLTNITDPTLWKPTGELGSSRRLEVTHYGPTNPNVTGPKLPTDQWFCASLRPDENRPTGDTPTWKLTTAISSPTACPTGYLPQFISSTFPSEGIYFRTGNTAEKDFPATNVTLPN